MAHFVFFSFFFNYYDVKQKINSIRLVECRLEDRNAHVVNVIMPRFNDLQSTVIYRLKTFTDFQPAARTLRHVEEVSSESRYYRVTRQPHATFGINL